MSAASSSIAFYRELSYVLESVLTSAFAGVRVVAKGKDVDESDSESEGKEEEAQISANALVSVLQTPAQGLQVKRRGKGGKGGGGGGGDGAKIQELYQRAREAVRSRMGLEEETLELYFVTLRSAERPRDLEVWPQRNKPESWKQGLAELLKNSKKAAKLGKSLRMLKEEGATDLASTAFFLLREHAVLTAPRPARAVAEVVDIWGQDNAVWGNDNEVWGNDNEVSDWSTPAPAESKNGFEFRDTTGRLVTRLELPDLSTATVRSLKEALMEANCTSAAALDLQAAVGDRDFLKDAAPVRDLPRELVLWQWTHRVGP